jgi:hypothetical protein
VPAFDYEPDGAATKRFMRSSAFVRGIRGPIGSGKSVACAVELFRRANEQAPDARGVRKTRWAVIRNTGPELKTTTIKTWLDWFPEETFGDFNWQPPYTHHIRRFSLDMEVLFLALDRPEDVKKLLSLELTGAWVNEAREIDKAIIDGATSRVDRYPSMKDGGATWAGVIMDTNSPDDDHWWPILSGEVPLPEDMDEDEALMLRRPDNWEFFTQPPGMVELIQGEGSNKRLAGYERNPDACNYRHLSPNYYHNLIRGKDRRWINIYVMNRLGATLDGKPIYSSYRAEVHRSASPLPIIAGADVLVGLDFGLTPAAVFAQRQNGRWLIQRELVARRAGALSFAPAVRQLLAEVYPWVFLTEQPPLTLTGDPAGSGTAQTDEQTVFDMFRAISGLIVRPASSNDFDLRVDSVEAPLTRMIDGRPGLLVDGVHCKVLSKAMDNGYCYRRLAIGGGSRFADRPDKNRYSHVAEALQYLMLGGGEGRALVRRRDAAKPFVAKRQWSPFQRGQSGRHKSG